MKLQGKVAVITGAGRVGKTDRKRGIGVEIAIHLAKQGANIVANDFTGTLKNAPDYDLSRNDELESVAEEIRALGRQAITVNADVSDSKAVDEMIKRTLNEFGRIDILVNNAGIGLGRRSIMEIDEKMWDLAMDVMAKGTFLCCKAAAKVMIQQGEGGRIVNISSIAGKIGSPFLAAYTAAKHAVMGLTRSLSGELIHYNINVNAVCPGFTDTHILHMKGRILDMSSKPANVSIDQELEKLYSLTPAHRMATVEEIANVVEFLCLPESSYVNGQGIVVDGGGVTI